MKKTSESRLRTAIKQMTENEKAVVDKGPEIRFGFNGIIVSKGIEFSSICEHHKMPFFGTVSVAYIPNGKKVIGLSKMARIVTTFSKRFQLQERMTNQIADALQDITFANGVAVLVSGTHTCQKCRGVEKNGEMVTLLVTGQFNDPIKHSQLMRIL